MITDALNQLAGSIVGNTITGQSLVGAAGTTTSTNVIDLAGSAGAQIADIGRGEGVEIAVQVVQTFAGGTSLAIAIALADDAGISVNVETVIAEAPIPIASLVAGARIPMHFDRASPLPAKRYAALQFTTVGTMTAGSVVAGLVKSVQDVQGPAVYIGGFTVV